MNTDKIILDKICKNYNGEQVVADFTYTFEAGSKTCIMGESGVGKTTLTRILLGLDKDYSGNMENTLKWSAVFQECRMVENISAFSNIRMAASKNVGNEEIENDFRQLLHEESSRKKVFELSGGMKRRTEIIRAMLSDSDAVLMDEPFAGLDADAKENTIKYILSKINNRTLIVVSHDYNDAKALEADICLLTRKRAVDTM